jgi:hypothetical protein
MQLRTPKHIRSIILSVSTCIRSFARCLVESFMVAASVIMGEAKADVKLRARSKWPRVAHHTLQRGMPGRTTTMSVLSRSVASFCVVCDYPQFRLHVSFRPQSSAVSANSTAHPIAYPGHLDQRHHHILDHLHARTHADDCLALVEHVCARRIC